MPAARHDNPAAFWHTVRMNHSLHRRAFLAAAGVAAAGAHARPASTTPAPRPQPEKDSDAHRGPCVIASGNGQAAVALAFDLLMKGVRPVEACVRGVKLVEDDPNDSSVGYGGLPNEEGVVELDAACMDGPLHRAGAVASLRNIKNPASVALDVLRRTDHVLLVGEGALKFARRMGYQEEDLLTESSRQAWLRWRASLNREDKWLDPDQEIIFPDPLRKGDAPATAPSPTTHVSLDDQGVPHTWGTIHCSALSGASDLGCCTTTSGLSWKLPGRVGDSPLIGAGLYCDNAIGSAGATGRGESVIQTLGSFWIVEAMGRGLTPTEACREACTRIIERTREPRLLDKDARPNFGVTFYALRKDGAYGSACILRGGSYAVADERGARVVESEPVLE